jgi:hypothetical protein
MLKRKKIRQVKGKQMIKRKKIRKLKRNKT